MQQDSKDGQMQSGRLARLFDPAVPFKPKQSKFYYGWWILIAIIVTTLLTAPGQTAGVSPFVEPLLELTGFSRQTLSITYLIGTLLSGCCLPFAGKYIDIWGSRLIVILAGWGLAFTLVWISFADIAFSRFDIALYEDLPLLGAIMLCFGFFCMRFCGQGMMILCGQSTAPRWFKKRRGLATGITGFVGALINPMAPLLLMFLITGYAWRGAWLVAAAIVFVVNTVVAWIIWRDSPESCGLPIDGKADESGQPDTETDGNVWTRGEAIKVPAYWVVVGSHCMLGLIITALSFHLVDIGSMRGLTQEQTITWYFPLTWTAMILGLASNFLADYMNYRVFLPLIHVFMIGAILLLEFVPGWWGFYGSASVYGMALAMAGPISVTTYPRWFGRVHLGAITGVNWAIVVMGSAVGPTFYSLLRDEQKGYALAGQICIGVLVVFFILSFVVPPPKSKIDLDR